MNTKRIRERQRSSLQNSAASMTRSHSNKVWSKKQQELVDQESKALEEALNEVRTVQYRFDMQQKMLDGEKQVLETLLEEQKDVNAEMCPSGQFFTRPANATAIQVRTWAQVLTSMPCVQQALVASAGGILREESTCTKQHSWVMLQYQESSTPLHQAHHQCQSVPAVAPK